MAGARSGESDQRGGGGSSLNGLAYDFMARTRALARTTCDSEHIRPIVSNQSNGRRRRTKVIKSRALTLALALALALVRPIM